MTTTAPMRHRHRCGTGTDAAPAPTRTVTGIRWLLICMSLYISIFIYGLDTTIAADIQGAVGEDFSHVEQLA